MAAGPDLLLGEWACLGVVVEAPAHGYAVAKRLAKGGDLGRVWTMSRPMAYRCLDVLEQHGLVEALPDSADARGKAVLRATGPGRRALHAWLDRPVEHLRDVRTELLVKLLISERIGRDRTTLLAGQRRMAVQRRAELEAELAEHGPADPVTTWRAESAAALERTLDRLDRSD